MEICEVTIDLSGIFVAGKSSLFISSCGIPPSDIISVYQTSSKPYKTLWTRGESNPLLFHAMEACYRYTTGPYKDSAILLFFISIFQPFFMKIFSKSTLFNEFFF